MPYEDIYGGVFLIRRVRNVMNYEELLGTVGKAS